MLVLGLMSGTSADGVDAAIVALEGAPPDLRWEVHAHSHMPHPLALRDEIFACFQPASSDVGRLCHLNFALGHAFADAALRAIAETGLSPTQIDLIGSHGQTLWHNPTGPQASTLQLGEPAVIAERTGIPVVSNFRTRDMAAGGQGAPLVAYVDALLLTHPTLTRAVQNIGGIANVTYLPPRKRKRSEDTDLAEGVTAFDTGPGNMLIDDAAARATDGRLTFDRDGQLALAGHVDKAWLKDLLADPYFKAPPPKTTGRERFGTQYGAKLWKEGLARELTPCDIVATLTALTASSIARAYRDFLPHFPDEVIVSGGGARNPRLMMHLREALPEARVCFSDKVGLKIEAKEAVAFAVLAYETWHRRPGNVPSATGASHPVILGSITHSI